ncbi:unnamed protein product [Eruca vesicaria subsp. sativa]|uniref:Uncharacterized protein n=1 Tax=Eruca vesicaria subsp. sativa TaxID=29727 RepID=A0ABC8JD53_ERUVS|nr:unnamed protein product [Eruca vesicaria subsp. sativa]
MGFAVSYQSMMLVKESTFSGGLLFTESMEVSPSLIFEIIPAMSSFVIICLDVPDEFPEAHGLVVTEHVEILNPVRSKLPFPNETPILSRSTSKGA